MGRLNRRVVFVEEKRRFAQDEPLFAPDPRPQAILLDTEVAAAHDGGRGLERARVGRGCRCRHEGRREGRSKGGHPGQRRG